MIEVFKTAIGDVLEAIPEPRRSDLRNGLATLKLPLKRLALDVLQVEEAGLSLRDAAHREADYPLVARIHHGLLDFLQYELLVAEASASRAVLSRLATKDPRPVRIALMELAAFSEGAGGALARFAWYQAIRLNVWVANWDDNGGLEAAGTIQRIDAIAERLLRLELEAVRRAPATDDPLPRFVAAALMQIEELHGAFRAEQRGSPREELREFDMVAEFFAQARAAAAPDAVIIRNGLERYLKREPLGDLRLAELHPLAFPSKDALHQRRHRLNNDFHETGAVSLPRKLRVIDLFREAL